MVVTSGNAVRRNGRSAGRPREDLPHGHNVALHRTRSPSRLCGSGQAGGPCCPRGGGTLPHHAAMEDHPVVAHGRSNGTIAPSFLVRRCPQAATPKFEVKRHGASGHSNDCMPVSPGSYSASNFAGAAHTAVLFSPPRDGFSLLDDLCKLLI